MARWCAIAIVLGAAGDAHALKPGAHADITNASCLAAGLPRDFCRRAATEDYDTDAREWDDLHAHAQIDDAETACTAADQVSARVHALAGELRALLATVGANASDANVGRTASALGRALHTIQDDCAHHGMPNPQHAWSSISDFCDDTALSPDIQDDAVACARAETDAVMTLVAAAVRRSGTASILAARSCPPSPNPKWGTPGACQGRFLPGPIDACRFLARARDWDGTDRRWEPSIVVPVVRAAFAAGLAGTAPLAAICGGDETMLSPATSAPLVDVSAGPASCLRSKVFCLGKADGDNPFADDPTAEPASDAGCTTTGRPSGVAVAALGLLWCRRRARGRGPR